MSSGIEISAAIMFAGSSLMGLVGTNAQARLAKSRLLSDPNPLVVSAGLLWWPSRWLMPPRLRRRRLAVERELRQDAESWRRYELLCKELFAWNALESAVVVALFASLAALVAVL